MRSRLPADGSFGQPQSTGRSSCDGLLQRQRIIKKSTLFDERPGVFVI
jgi:hypothetical protein